MSSCWKLTSVYYYNSLALKNCCLTTPLNYFQLSLFTLNFCVLLGFFGCCVVFGLAGFGRVGLGGVVVCFGGLFSWVFFFLFGFVGDFSFF